MITNKIINGLFGVGSFLLLVSCGNEKTAGQQNENLIPAVEVVQSGFGSLPLTERLTGVVKAKNQVAIYAELSAPIMEVFVRDGDYIEKGEPLVRLRDVELRERLRQARASLQIARAQVKQAQARLKEIEAELKRTESLAEKQLTSPADLETVQTRAISAEADLELARARIEQAEATVKEREEALSQTIIRAPVAGNVGNRNAEVGMLVTAGTRLFTLGQLDEVEIEIILTDRMLNYIEQGQRAEVLTGNTERRSLVGSISRISPFLHPVTHSTAAEIDLPNTGRLLKAGMFVAVDIYYGESEQATLIPLSGLYENPLTAETGVYVTDDSLNREGARMISEGQNIVLTEPVNFEFVPVEILAKGRMEAGVRGIEQDSWLITLGQDLLAGKSGEARARLVNKEWVYELQRLQRQDLMQDVMRQQKLISDSLNAEAQSSQLR